MFRILARHAEAAGWSIELTRNNHLRWRSPDGAVVFSALSPSDRRAVRNVEKELRRAGLSI